MGDTGVKFIQTENIKNNNFKNFYIKYPGENIDPEHKFTPFLYPFYSERGGKFYSFYAPAFTFLSAIPYKLFGYYGLYIIPSLSFLLIIILVFNIGKMIGKKIGLGAAIVTAFASPLYFYGITFWGHTLSIFLGLLSLFLFLKGSLKKRIYLFFWAGFIAIAGIMTREEIYAIILAFPIAYLLSGKISKYNLKEILIFLSTAIFAVIIYLIITSIVTGVIGGYHLNFYLSFTEKTIGTFLKKKIDLINNMLIPLWNRKVILGLLMPFIIFIGCKVFKTKGNVAKGVFASSVILAIIYGTAFTFHRRFWWSTDLLIGFPLVLFTYFGLWVSLKREKKKLANTTENFIMKFTMWSSIFFVIFVMIAVHSWGGSQWGPRYILFICPLLAILIMGIFKKAILKGTFLGKGVISLLFIYLIIFSIIMQGYSLYYIYSFKKMDKKINDITLNTTPEVILTDRWWFHQVCAPIFYEKKIFFLEDMSNFWEFVEALRKHNVDKFSLVTSRKASLLSIKVPERYGLKIIEKKSIKERELDYITYTLE